jgi:aspartate/methionine/tyrosine aminotransferase
MSCRLKGILNVLLATVEPGQEVVIGDPIYAGLVNRIRLAGGIPRLGDLRTRFDAAFG